MKNNKTVFYEKGNTMTKEDDKSRITLQLRSYGVDGEYDKDSELSNATIWIKNIKDVNKVHEIIKNALMNSKYLDDKFEVR